jgi:hypothetical protein
VHGPRERISEARGLGPLPTPDKSGDQELRGIAREFRTSATRRSYNRSPNMTQNVEIVIGNRGADCVLIRVIEPALAGWMRADVEVRCDGWAGKLKWSLMSGELARFAGEIRQLRRQLHGTATLEPLEPNIRLTFIGDGKGHVAVQGIAQNNFASGTELRFDLTIDQTYLEEIADSLSQADPA